MNKSTKALALFMLIVAFAQVGLLTYGAVEFSKGRKSDRKDSEVSRYLIAKSSRDNVAFLAGAARAGCGRSKKDRRAAIAVNRAILEAFAETDERLGNLTLKRRQSEAQLRSAIKSLKVNANIDCRLAYPDPPPLANTPK